jgi:hypothetical protein
MDRRELVPVINLPNSLLIGLAAPIRKALNRRSAARCGKTSS